MSAPRIDACKKFMQELLDLCIKHGIALHDTEIYSERNGAFLGYLECSQDAIALCIDEETICEVTRSNSSAG